ncbi:Protein FAN [Nymphon striatum]|nr:Protein FAN [Nymphon striatum]
MRKPDKASLRKVLLTEEIQCSANEVMEITGKYVLDGGALLHRVHWVKGIKFNEVAKAYVNYIRRNYGSAFIVFDGYDSPESIKSNEHLRRAGSKGSTPNIIITENNEVPYTKERFLSNSHNKTQLISFLADHLTLDGQAVHVCRGDADTKIVSTALEVANDSTTIVVADDTDVAVMLLYHWNENISDVFFLQERGKKCWSIRKAQLEVLDFKEHLLFIHAWSGCDSTSAIFGKGKASFLNLVKKSKIIQLVSETICDYWATQSDVGDASMKAFVELYGGNSKQLRFSLLLLDPGEIYFEDYGVNFYTSYFTSKSSEQSKFDNVQKGRLKICSKSIVFDPRDISFPVLKFPLKDCKDVSEWSGDLLSKLGNKRDGIVVESNLTVEMLKDNVIAPYEFNKNKQKYLFTLQFIKVEDCLPNICQLMRASTLPGAEQAAMIGAIVTSRQSRVTFNTSWLDNLYENILLEKCCNKICALVTNPGRVVLTSSRLYFQPYNNAEPFPVLKIKLKSIKTIIRRRFLLRHVGLEITCEDSATIKHLYLTFNSPHDRDELYYQILDQPNLKLDETPQENMTLLWQNGILSNYDYLLFLNSQADRSFNDLTQYPVFPFIIQDYTCSDFDLSDPNIFRDLSKPIGALNPDRLARLKERFAEMTENPFLYGSHYSTPGFVLYYLVRECNMIDTWKNVTTGSADFKEMIPAFYEPENKGQFLVNSKNIDFGVRYDGQKVDGVDLPNWAKDPEDYIIKLRKALECEYVSENLHHWIDLVFGYKQKGEEAVKANNVFYYLTYEGAIDLDKIRDLNERYSMEVQINEFGQIPKQIFNKPHPRRSSKLPISYNILITPDEIDGKIKDEVANNKSAPDLENKVTSWKKLENLNLYHEFDTHKGAVSDICITDDKAHIFSVSKDNLLKMYSIEKKCQERSISVAQMPLSSCVLMADQKTVIVGCNDNCIYAYNVEYGKLLGSRYAHDDAVCDIDWKNNILATASWDSTAKTELDHDYQVTCLVMDSSNSMLITGTTSGEMILWSLSSFNRLQVYSDDQRIASCGQDGYLKVLDVGTGMQVFSKQVDNIPDTKLMEAEPITDITAKSVAMAFLKVWISRFGLPLCVHMDRGKVSCIQVSQDGNLVVSGGEDGKICIWKPI